MGDDRPGIRVGDVERGAVESRLRDAHVEGRLTLDELSERLEECWAARTRADLGRLTEDLPPAADAVGVEPARPARRESGKAAAHRVRSEERRVGKEGRCR